MKKGDWRHVPGSRAYVVTAWLWYQLERLCERWRDRPVLYLVASYLSWYADDVRMFFA